MYHILNRWKHWWVFHNHQWKHSHVGSKHVCIRCGLEPSVLLRLLDFPFPQCVHTNLFSTHAHNIFDISTFIHQQSENESEDDQFGILKTEQNFVNGLKCFCVEKLIRAERNIQGSIHTGMV